MTRILVSLGILFFCSYSALGQGNPVVAVLRDSEPSFIGEEVGRDTLVLLDSNANPIHVFSGVGACQSLSQQNTLQFDEARRRVIVAENLRDRVSAFSYEGTPELVIAIENASAVFLSPDAKLIGCVTGPTIDNQQTVIFEANSGMETRRLNWGGLAFINDQAGPAVWAAGRQLIRSGFDGEIAIRRPLTQLPAETEYPTVINSRNWCATGLAIESNENEAWRRIWAIEREHSDVKGSRNRLFAVAPDGQTRILVELNDIDPRSITCATYKGDLKRILVVDGKTGDLVSFNSDGELMGRDELDVQLVAFGDRAGLWVASRKTMRQLDPTDLSVIAEHVFDEAFEPIGLTVR